jgi:alpha-D-ribose 1-methylphosphonate 5-triphosphate synthase subunit PhnH
MMPAKDLGRLRPGFKNPVFDSQATFRCILDAMAYPGRIQTIDNPPDAPAGLSPAAAAACLTLVDFETPLWLDQAGSTDETIAYLRFHCGAPLVEDASFARFALVAAPALMPHLAAFSAGEDEYPDRSATLILQVPALTGGPKKTWSGPGIRGTATTSVAGLADWFWQDWKLNRELYPLGVDIVFVSRDAVLGLPRSIRSED